MDSDILTFYGAAVAACQNIFDVIVEFALVLLLLSVLPFRSRLFGRLGWLSHVACAALPPVRALRGIVRFSHPLLFLQFVQLSHKFLVFWRFVEAAFPPAMVINGGGDLLCAALLPLRGRLSFRRSGGITNALGIR